MASSVISVCSGRLDYFDFASAGLNQNALQLHSVKIFVLFTFSVGRE